MGAFPSCPGGPESRLADCAGATAREDLKRAWVKPTDDGCAALLATARPSVDSLEGLSVAVGLFWRGIPRHSGGVATGYPRGCQARMPDHARQRRFPT
eukprot:3106039-Alexandrium_andersonii.AAC.1